MKIFKLLVPALFLVVAGCSSKDGLSTDGMGTDGMGTDDGASTYGTLDGADGSATPIGDDRDAIVMNDRIIYFAFDSAELDDASIELLRQHGRYLADNPGEKVRLEGHTDERGSREYNIGLGERRAVSVQSVLLVQGAAVNQLATVSFGEERPAALGSDETAYGQNRRVEIVYER
ncbi:MAG: peptidoglycan-associated lipoprotein Pal [Gammaproteobacteria bacterium]|jgi:peptidoglycan-associated lipoprotein